MSCSDVCMYSGADMSPDFFRRKEVRAAKAYKCGECGVPIAQGETYEYVAGKWDGYVDTFRTCLACAEIRDVFYCDGSALGALREDVFEQLFPEWNDMTAVDCLARLKTEGAVAKLRAMYAEYQEAQA